MYIYLYIYIYIYGPFSVANCDITRGISHIQILFIDFPYTNHILTTVSSHL